MSYFGPFIVPDVSTKIGPLGDVLRTLCAGCVIDITGKQSCHEGNLEIKLKLLMILNKIRGENDAHCKCGFRYICRNNKIYCVIEMVFGNPQSSSVGFIRHK